MNNAIFQKSMENVKNIKFITTAKRINYLVSVSNYHKIKKHSENVLALKMRKTQTLMNKPVYLGLSIL